DVDGDQVSFFVVSQPEHGTLTGTPPQLTYTPAANYNGSDRFVFKANDGHVDSDAAEVSITVETVNDPPVAQGQDLTTAEDTALNLALTGSDVDGDSLGYVITAQPTHGTLSGTAPNLTYTPAHDFAGADQFAFEVNDGQVNSVEAIVHIT